MRWQDSTGRFGAKDAGTLAALVSPTEGESFLSAASEGAMLLADLAAEAVARAISEHGDGALLSLPGTEYGLPCLYGWKGVRTLALGEAETFLQTMAIPEPSSPDCLRTIGENSLLAAEIAEAAACISGSGACIGFIPDSEVAVHGLSVVDGTIPGAAVLLADSGHRETAEGMAAECLSRGMLAMVCWDSGAGAPACDRKHFLGEAAGAFRSLSFAVRVALSMGGVRPGDRKGLSSYLDKRFRVAVIGTGAFSRLDAAFFSAALLHGASVVTDRDIPGAPEGVSCCEDGRRMVIRAIEERGIEALDAFPDIPVRYGPEFEGELVKGEHVRLVAGGDGAMCFELLTSADGDAVEDGRVHLIGRDIGSFGEGDRVPLALVVEVYGREMHADLESVMERRIHRWINFAEGVWHSGQRDSVEIRVSGGAHAAGFVLKDLGRIVVSMVKREFGRTVTRVQCTVVTDPLEVGARHPGALAAYRRRDLRTEGLKDPSVDDFYSCSMCRSRTPDHLCIISPERPGLCGSVSWLDAKAGKEISPCGPYRPVAKGIEKDPVRGEWTGVNEAVRSATAGAVPRVCMYSIMDAPMTSCGCMEAVVAVTADARAFIIADRDYRGMTPAGVDFPGLAAHAGSGIQTPGFMGIGKSYIASERFISAEGGLPRVAWMTSRLKALIGPELRRRCEELGMPDLLCRIADETVTEDAEGLAAWMEKVDHPALHMDPLL
ncbi:MAG: hypothetical protein RBQ77_01525 [Candidatus Methanomethylophilaceae archaeon]|nr:hypothetical protein [Candidatus Methanomethylophilaceae archaeon]NLF33484.1 hypothetical protein [Thermoplasmatales archaeon]